MSLLVWLARNPPQTQSICLSGAQPPYPILLWKADGLFCAVPHSQATHSWTRSTCLVCIGVRGTGIQVNDWNTHRSSLCRVWRLLQFTCLSGMLVCILKVPRLAEWSRGSVWLPTEGGNLCVLVFRYCDNERCRLDVAIVCI